MRFTYYTIIGKNPQLIDEHLKNIRYHAGFDRLECEKELLIIIYKNSGIHQTTTNEIIGVCNKHNARYYIYNEPVKKFIDNLYACWNLGYQQSKDGWVFRGGSDQAFNKDSFINLYRVAENTVKTYPKMIFQAQTIENANYIKPKKIHSRHFVEAFGDDFNSFKIQEFENFVKRINSKCPKELASSKDCLKIWGKPTALRTSLGRINRTDGCSWLMTKEDWKKYGPLVVMNKDKITGDVLIHDTLQKNGYKNRLVRDCVTYHFVRGESRQQYKT